MAMAMASSHSAIYSLHRSHTTVSNLPSLAGDTSGSRTCEPANQFQFPVLHCHLYALHIAVENPSSQAVKCGWTWPRGWQIGARTRRRKCNSARFVGVMGAIRCASKPAMRVLKDAEKRSGDSARSVLRKLRNLSRVAQMEVLEELIQRDRIELVLPMYEALQKAAWYKWDAKLHARIVAMAANGKQAVVVTSHVLEPQEPLSLKQRAELQCALIESYAYLGLQEEANEAFQSLYNFPLAKARPLAFKAMVQAYCLLANPTGADLILSEMKTAGHKPSVSDYKVILMGYGKAGMLSDMERIALDVQDEGLSLDTSGYNIMISAYCHARKLEKMLEILRRMDAGGVRPNIVSWNALTRACPTLVALGLDCSCALASSNILLNRLHQLQVSFGEISIVQTLLTRGIPPETLSFSSNMWQLDLHNMSLGTASVVLPLWLSSLKGQLLANAKVPMEVRLVTGWGKHSEADVKAPIRRMIMAELEAMKSPFKADSENRGALIARGSSLKNWLLTSPS